MRKFLTKYSAAGTFDTVDNFCHTRSEEHTSELQSQSNLVCRLLLEKKKTGAHRNASLHCCGASCRGAHRAALPPVLALAPVTLPLHRLLPPDVRPHRLGY